MKNEISYDDVYDVSCASFDDAYYFCGCFCVGKTLRTKMTNTYPSDGGDDDGVCGDGHSQMMTATRNICRHLA